MKPKHLIFFMALLLVVAAFLVATEKPEAKTLEINGREFKIEVADDFEEMKKGLSGRERLPDESGMLFIFGKPDRHGIWMKEMRFAIDIVWLDETGAVVDITKNARPESYPAIFQPQIPAKYVLEINSGLSDQVGIEIGDKMEYRN